MEHRVLYNDCFITYKVDKNNIKLLIPVSQGSARPACVVETI